MPKHLIAFKRSTGTTGSFEAMEAVRDSVLAMASTESFFVPPGARIVAAYVGSDGNDPGPPVVPKTLADAQINSPTFRSVGLPAIRPLNPFYLAGDDPNVMVIVGRPLRYADVDTLSVEITNPATADEDTICLIWLALDDEPIPPGDTYWLRYTNTAAAPAATPLEWTSMPLTTEQLPEGEYIICGMEHVSDTCLGARLVFPGSPWRPGTLGQAALTNQNHAVFYDDRLGVYGRFNAFAPPTLESLCSGADTTFTGYFRVMRVK